MNKSFGHSWTTYYRPHGVKHLHQRAVREQLSQYMKDGYFPRVLLFAGPKGTGKTTSARLIGAILNDPGNQQQVESTYLRVSKTSKVAQPLSEPDATNPLIKKILQGTSYVVQELDAASNRGIQEVRNLQDKVMMTPVEGSISVFILDEVHMLTTPAFNALLKLLEEPPNHVIFILATTELHKLPETVRSRCQIITFHKSSTPEIAEALATIGKSEELTIEAEAVEAIAQLADGSFRDAVKFLQMVAHHTPITAEHVFSTIQASYETQVRELIQTLLDKDIVALTEQFASLRNQLVNSDHFYKQLLTYIHDQLVNSITQSATDQLSTTVALFLLKELTKPEVQQPTPIPLLGLEIACLDMVQRSSSKKATDSPPKPRSPKPKITTVSESIGLRQPSITETHQPHSTSSTSVPGDAQQLLERWQEFTSSVATKNATLAALFRSAQPTRVSDHKICLRVYYRFHQEQLSHPKSIRLIEDIVQSMCRGHVELDVVVETTTPESAELVEHLDPTDNPSFADQVVSVLR